jgi:hypothetical protein
MNACRPIANDLYTKDVHIPCNLDYVIATYTMTSFCMIRTGKLEESLKLLSEAEKLVFQLVKYSLEDVKPP